LSWASKASHPAIRHGTFGPLENGVGSCGFTLVNDRKTVLKSGWAGFISWTMSEKAGSLFPETDYRSNRSID
jgi:hypothetical protein